MTYLKLLNVNNKCIIQFCNVDDDYIIVTYNFVHRFRIYIITAKKYGWFLRIFVYIKQPNVNLYNFLENVGTSKIV